MIGSCIILMVSLSSLHAFLPLPASWPTRVLPEPDATRLGVPSPAAFLNPVAGRLLNVVLL